MKDRYSKNRGLSILELFVVIGILSVISFSIFRALQVTTRLFKIGTTDLKSTADAQIQIPPIERRLQSAKEILAVSLVNDTNGFIQYVDAADITVTVFLNTAGNQSTFFSNTFSNDNLVVHFSDTAETEILVDAVISFNITTYKEDASYFRVASPNNITTPNFAEINSARLIVQRNPEETPARVQKLISLSKGELAASGNVTYGEDYNGSTLFPFSSHLSFPGFTLNNMQLSLDNLFSSEADGAFIPTPSETVKIKNTGLYFNAIQDAIDAASSGDIIAIGDKGSPYVEAIIIKPGVRLEGGYDPSDWSRNPDDHETILKAQGGISDKAIIMRSNTHLDGITVDADDLINAIVVDNADGFSIRNCKIINCDRAIELDHSYGTIANNSATANEYVLLIDDSNTFLNIYRNRFFSNNQAAKENIFIQDSTNVNLNNNVIIDGFHTILTFNSSIVMNNNIITASEHFGIFKSGGGSLVAHNNVLYENDVGYFSSFPGVDTLRYNLFSDNFSGSTAGGIVLHPSNIVDPTNYTWGTTDPYFDNIVTYELKGSSPLIDAGNPAASFDDLLGSDLPGKGGNRNDIGLYGGPTHGRLGVGTRTAFAAGSAFASIETAINTTLPGDEIILGKGSFTLTSPLTLRPNTTVYGAGAESTFVTCSGTRCFTMEDNTHIANMQLNGSSNDGILASSVSTVRIEGTIVNGFNNGVIITSTSPAELRHNTFTGNSNGVVVNGGTSEANISNSVFSASSVTAIDVNAGDVDSIYNYFHNNSSNTAGTITLDPSPDLSEIDPVFFDTANGIYFLHPSSNAINATSNNVDLGALEFFSNVGVLTTPTLSVGIKRGYKSFVVGLFGPTGDVPSTDARHSTVQFTYFADGATQNVSNTISITQNVQSTITVDLPPTTIANDFILRTTVTSYRFGKTPYINSLRLNF